MQLMMIAWPILALVILQTLYAFGFSSTLTWSVPQIDSALCKSFSFNQIYVLPSTSLNVSLSLNSKKHQINYALCILLSRSPPSILLKLPLQFTQNLQSFLPWRRWELPSPWVSGMCEVWGLSPSFPSWPASCCFFMRNSASCSSPLRPLILLPRVLLREVQRSPEASTWLCYILLP